MKNQALYEYLAAFVTIVLAIALSDMLMSLHRLLIARSRVKWSVIPLAVAFFVFLNLLSEFFSIWHYADVKTVSFLYLVFLVCVSASAAMAAFVALPDEIPLSGLSLWDSYSQRRAQLWALMGLGWLGDVGRHLVFNKVAGDAVSFEKFASTYVVLAVCIALAWRSQRWVHGVGIAVLFAAVMPNFLRWSIG